MRYHLSRCLASIALLTFCFFFCLPVYGQNSDSIPQIFERIRLTSDGVVAFDTTGKRWRYDFDQAAFFRDTLPYDSVVEAGPKPVAVRAIKPTRVSSLQDSPTIEYDEFVTHDIVALGQVTIRGWAKGEVESINGSVTVTETGQVDGDIRAPEIVIKPGGIHRGRQYITTPVNLAWQRLSDWFDPDAVTVTLSFTLFFLVGSFVVISLMSRQMANINRCINNYRGKTYFIGLLFLLLIPFILIILAISILGILLIPLLPFLYLFAALLGAVAFGQLIGDTISKRIRLSFHPLASAITGVVIYMALWWLATILKNGESTLERYMGQFMFYLSALVSTYPLLTGIGAVVLTRFGTRPYVSFSDRQTDDSAVLAAPIPPPIPNAPPVLPGHGKPRPPLHSKKPE